MTELYEEINTSSSFDSQKSTPEIFERAIIGCLLQRDPYEVTKIAAECPPEVFGSSRNLFAYNILRNAAFSNTPLGYETAAGAIEQSPGSREYFPSLIAVKEFLDDCKDASRPCSSWPEYTKQIHLAHTRRTLLAAFDDATISALSADNAENATADAIYKVIEAAGELRRSAVVKDQTKISSIVERYIETYKKQEGISFCFPQEKLNFAGGARKGQVIVVAAESGVGKSWWTLDTVLEAMINRGKSARIYTLEMSEADIVDRALAMVEGLSLDEIIQQKANLGDIERGAAKLLDMPLTIVDQRISPGRIVADLAGLGEDRPDIVVVDHLDLFQWKDGNEVNALKGALANFKDAAKQYGVTFILVSQFRRPQSADEAAYPHIRMLKGGSAIEQIADIIFFITKEVKQSHFGDEEILHMSVPKARQGKKPKKFRVRFRDYRFR